jgi:hypothetical protein
MREVAEGGTLSVKLYLDTALLWNKDSNNADCPSSIPFSFQLPTTFTHAEKTYVSPF